MPVLFYKPDFSHSPKQKAQLIDHLIEVNARWKYVALTDDSYFEETSFPDDITRISKHLEKVEDYLRNREPFSLSEQQKKNRLGLLDQLLAYQVAKRFPINLYHSHRRPYFIDEYGTACAVGHLLQKSGNQDFALQISQEMNYAYLLDMPYPEIDKWADQHGFSKEELALIQPGYSPNVSWESLGAGADGEVTALYGDEENQRLVLAGNFSSLNGIVCNQVGVYADGTFAPLGNGVQGTIEDIISFEGNIYLGGLFSDSSNIAFWDGQNWNHEQLGKGTVYDLEVDGNNLIAVGDFSYPAGQNQPPSFISKKENGSWVANGSLLGPAYCITMHQGVIYLGGDFMYGPSPSYVQKLNGNNWQPATQHLERLDAPVRSLVSDGSFLYAGGDCRGENDEVTFCFARLGNSGWERLMDHDVLRDGRGVINKLILHEGSVLVAGDFKMAPIVGIFGGGIAKFRDLANYPIIEAIADLDSAVHAVASVNGELYTGGTFFSQFPFQPDTLSFLAKTPNLTSVDPDKLASVSISPNPMKDRSWLKINTIESIDRVEAYAISGNRINLSVNIMGNEIELIRGQVPPGMILLKVYGKDGILAIGKLLLF
ncbi:MAG: T9SS type A sorting domain-containing protein [Bacteroidota bacterium]